VARVPTVAAIRLQNFMGFEDTDWIELRSITLLFGRNSTGKSSIIRALLLLRQSMSARDVVVVIHVSKGEAGVNYCFDYREGNGWQVYVRQGPESVMSSKVCTEP